MQNATTIALSRLVAQQRAMDVTATNIANAGTPGFRAERVLFSDWLVKAPPFGQPPGGRITAYTQDRATYRDMQAGSLDHTGNPLDLTLGGDGFFTVQTPRGPRLTRAGHFQLGTNGTIVDEQGEALLDTNGQPLRTAASDTVLTVAADGTLASENGQIGKIGVVNTDTTRLQAEGSRLYDTSVPTSPVASPQIVQGAIEESNVQPTLEVTRMMTDLREFQFVTQFVQAEADRQQNAIDRLLPRQT